VSSFVAVHIVNAAPPVEPFDPAALAAVRFDDGQEADRLDLRVKPLHEMSLPALRAAGLEAAGLASAPDSATQIKPFLKFLGKLPVVTPRPRHDGEFFRAFAPKRFQEQLLDLNLLARTTFPTMPSHDAASLAQAFQMPGADQAAPIDRAALAGRLWLKTLLALEDLPWVVLTQMVRLLDGTDHPLLPMILAAETKAVARGFGSKGRAYADLVQDFSADMRRKPAPPNERPEPLNVNALADFFRQGGKLMKALPGYEERPEQAQMVEAVCQALNGDNILLVEAGTGVGKSLAYLVPAILWARQNQDKVVISTNTKNLQEQLCSKDLPLLERALDVKFNAAIIKGRANYLCPRKFLYELREAQRELTAAERAAILPLVVWFPETATGDMAEASGFQGPLSSDLTPRFTTRADECVGMACRQARNCFVRAARGRAMAADIIIANHSVVFSEMGLDSPVLPPHARIVFDEAHNVERVATEHFARRVSQGRLYRSLNRFHASRRDGTGRGLLSSLRFQLSRSRQSIGGATADLLDGHIEPCINAMAEVSRRVQTFDAAVSLLVPPGAGGRVRYHPSALPSSWPEAVEAASDLAKSLGPLLERVKAISAGVQTLGAGMEETPSLLTEMAAAAGGLREFADDLNFCIEASDPGYVFWAEAAENARGQNALCAAPLEIGPLMSEGVYSVKRTAVFCSATLTVNGQFDFVRDRLGLGSSTDEEAGAADRVRCLGLGASFDYRRQSLLGVMSFLPPPTEGESFTAAFCQAAIATLRATRGRGLVLFTSHRMLRDAYPVVKQALEPEGIRVLAQEIDGDRAMLARVFQEDVSSVLLGAQSFWEGVDVPGESLSCLILARLPFQVFTDPVVEARCEAIEARGGNAFFGYSVPSAVIRLKQGFGRLIRNRSDRGVVLIGDSRVLAKSYGRQFLNSLPAPARSFRDLDQMTQAVAAFFRGS